MYEIKFQEEQIKMLLFLIRQYKKHLDMAIEDDSKVLEYLDNLSKKVFGDEQLYVDDLHMLLSIVDNYDRHLDAKIDDNFNARVLCYDLKMKFYELLNVRPELIFAKDPREEGISKKR
jgi:hypothetical protein